MKKSIIFIITIFFLISVCVLSIGKGYIVYADNLEEDTTETSSIDDTIDELLDKTDVSALQSWVDSMGIGENYSVKELFYAVLHNDFSMDFTFFLQYIFRCFFGNIKELLAEMLLILIIVVLLGIMQNITSGFIKDSTKKIVYVACYGGIVGILGVIVTSISRSAIEVINGVASFSEIVFPVLLTLVTTIGSTTSVAIYQPLVVVFSQVLVKIIQLVVMPTFYISVVFAIIGNIGDEIKLNKFSDTAKSFANWIMGIVFGLFITYTTARGITGASIDSLAVQSTKYALSNYVPVVGSYLKEGFDIITAGCIIIKNGLGFVSLVLLLLFIIGPTVKILSASLVMKLASAICEPFGEKKISEVLSSVSKSLIVPFVACIALCFTTIIMVSLIILTCNGGVL